MEFYKHSNTNKKKKVASKNQSENIRAICARVITESLQDDNNLTTSLKKFLNLCKPQDQKLVSEICYEVMRNKLRLEACLDLLLTQKLRNNQLLLKNLIIVGFCQLIYTNVPKHAAVNETVAACSDLKLNNFKSLVNAILHKFIEKYEEFTPKLDKSYETKYSFPQWLIGKLKTSYPQELRTILENSNSHPPMWIRVNKNKYTISEYQSLLKKNNIESSYIAEFPDALLLNAPVSVEKLPHFDDGASFVQDAAAQQAAALLSLEKDDIVLDCCCAPGGKTTHILELCNNIKDLVAIDAQESRIPRVISNLTRMKIQNKVKVVCYDASADPKEWSPYQTYNKILLDAPCSALGVIRRHPDIKWLRTEAEIKNICNLQQKILNNVWNLLSPGGILVYATCSILPEENKKQVSEFLKTHKDAELIPIVATENIDNPGLQRLPGIDNTDGFYYARITKKK